MCGQHENTLRTGYNSRGGALFIPIKAALWCMKPKRSSNYPDLLLEGFAS